MPPPIVCKRKRRSRARRKVREKVARQLEESMAAFLTSSKKLPETPPESQDRAPDSKVAMLHPSQATLDNPDSANLIPVIDLGSDSEVDSEAEAVIMMEMYSKVRISTRRLASRIRILSQSSTRLRAHWYQPILLALNPIQSFNQSRHCWWQWPSSPKFILGEDWDRNPPTKFRGGVESPLSTTKSRLTEASVSSP